MQRTTSFSVDFTTVPPASNDPNLNIDDTELIKLSSDYLSASRCSRDPPPLIGTYSLLYPTHVQMANGNPLVCQGNVHWAG